MPWVRNEKKQTWEKIIKMGDIDLVVTKDLSHSSKFKQFDQLQKTYSDRAPNHTLSVSGECWQKLRKIQKLLPIHCSMVQVLRMVINASNETAIKNIFKKCGVEIDEENKKI